KSKELRCNDKKISGKAFLVKTGRCYCCDRDMYAATFNQYCIGELGDNECKYVKFKGKIKCRPDGNCNGKDSWLDKKSNRK
ncbi:unnamed protein product, partial [marine sediment metagenome]